MLLTVDIGNTNITLGVFDGDGIVAIFRLTTKNQRTSDEYGLTICGLLRNKGIEPKSVDAAIIASVVPGLMHSFTSGIIKYLNITPMIVETGTKTGIKVNTVHPKEIGADRIVDAVAGHELYGSPVLVIDFGTATTYDLVLEGGMFTAGITAPGLRMCATALCRDTAKLPEVEIAMPKSILAKETVSSIQAGLLYGCIGQTEYIIKKVKEEAGLDKMMVVATGGLGKIISNETKMIDVFDPNLTLKGLKLIFNKAR